MKWIGITGGIGSGKSLVCEFLMEQGYSVISADKVVRSLSEPQGECYREILEKFGPEILDKQNHIDRKKLGAIVFNDINKLHELEKILHPEVKKRVSEIKSILTAQGKKLAFYEVPLLFEKKMQDQFDLILTVVASEHQQILRLKKRDGLSEQEAKIRIKAQLPMSEKIRESHFIIENSGTKEFLQKQVLNTLQKILSQE